MWYALLAIINLVLGLTAGAAITEVPEEDSKVKVVGYILTATFLTNAFAFLTF